MRSSVKERSCSLSLAAGPDLRKAGPGIARGVDRRAEPRQSLLQSVSLGHREAAPHRCGHAAQRGAATLAPSTGQLCDNVVTVMPMFNTYCSLPCLPRFRRVAAADMTAPRPADLRRTLIIPHQCGEKGKRRLRRWLKPRLLAGSISCFRRACTPESRDPWRKPWRGRCGVRLASPAMGRADPALRREAARATQARDMAFSDRERRRARRAHRR